MVSVDASCAWCDAPFKIKHAKRLQSQANYCTRDCRWAALRSVSGGYEYGIGSGMPVEIGAVTKIAPTNCSLCGNLYIVRGRAIGAMRASGVAYCSDACRIEVRNTANRKRWPAAYERNKDQHIASAQRRRARMANAPFTERVLLRVVAERDHWKCHICGQKVQPSTTDRRKRPSIDHLVPLSLGGEHSYRNVALAHQGCNSSKGVKATGEQLMLVG